MLQPGLAVRLFATPGAIRPRPRDASVREHGPGDPPAPASGLTIGGTRAGAALDGIRVVDLTQVLAGPTATRTLAEFGADVVKINNPGEEGAGYRWQVHRYHTDVNRGKRTILRRSEDARGTRRAFGGSSSAPTSSCRISGRASRSAWASATSRCG